MGRAAHLRDRDDAGAFLVFAEPLPVGTSIVLKLDGGEQPARVSAVVESADPNVAGMRLSFRTTAEVASPAAPAASTSAAPAPEPSVQTLAAVEPPAPVESSPPSTSAVEPSAPTSGGGEPASESGPSGAPSSTSEGDSGTTGHGKRHRRRRR